jgi:DtxR family transcriptional regulator, Mn-dependent transcriptional regulator
MSEKNLSSRLEDYLEAIYLLSRDKNFAHANKIAEFLDVGKSSVSWALNQLSKKELVNYTPYEAITLTPKGKALGQRLAQRHDEIKNFLTEVLAINENLAEENACRMEHVVDKEILLRMQQFMDFLQKCPRAGREWMKGFGFFCEQGKKRENCTHCVHECLEEVKTEIPILQESPSGEELPKVTKDRDRITFDRLREVAVESGRPLNALQEQVIELFMKSETHRTLEAIYKEAHKNNSRIKRVGVEQALQILCEHKIARSFRFQDQTVYEHYHPESHHDHLYCVKCGAIVEFFDPRIELLQMENTRRADFRLLQHNLNLYGVCHDCIKQQSKIRSLNDCLTDETVQVVRIVAEDKTAKRIMDMGITKGVILRILNSDCSGSNVMILVGHARLMFDPETARKIQVITAKPEEVEPPYSRRRGRHRHAADRMDNPKKLRN